jgi:hypothetical protein
MKPDTEIGDLIGWLSSITCTPFLIPSTVGIAGKKVTVIAPQAMTPGEAYRLFYARLESVGLTVEPSGRFLRIVDTGRARMTKLPYYGDHDAIPRDKRFITKLVRVENLDPTELVNSVLNRIKGETGDIIAYRASLIITDTAENVERMVDDHQGLRHPLGLRRVAVDHPGQEHVRHRDGLAPVGDRARAAGGRAAAAGRCGAAPRAPAAAGKGAANALPGRSQRRDDHQQDRPRRALEQPAGGGQPARLRLAADHRAQAGPAARQRGQRRRRQGARLLLRERQLRRAGRHPQRRGRRLGGGRRVGGGRRTRTSTPGAPAPPPIPSPAGPGAEPGRPRCCSRGTCASPSTPPPTRCWWCRRSRTSRPCAR